MKGKFSSCAAAGMCTCCCASVCTCNVRLFPLQPRALPLLWRLLQAPHVQRASLWWTRDVLLLVRRCRDPADFGLGCPLRLLLVKCAGSVEQWHLASWDAFPQEIAVLHGFVRDEVEAPAVWSVLQVFPQGSLVLHLKLVPVNWTEEVSSDRAVPQGAQDALLAGHNSALLEKERKKRISFIFCWTWLMISKSLIPQEHRN